MWPLVVEVSLDFSIEWILTQTEGAIHTLFPVASAVVLGKAKLKQNEGEMSYLL